MKQSENNNTPENNTTLTLDNSFATLGLREALFNNLTSLNYEQMTPIQAQSLPPMLQGHDIIAQAKTGSGKTAAFGLLLLNSLNLPHFAVQALVMCPTRELAEQVRQTLRRLARLLPNVKILNLSGGMPMKPQIDSLIHGAHVVVGTPGRIQKHLNKESLVLNKLQTLILDEADRMLDMGFFDAVKDIINSCPKNRQTLLFSATYPAEIKQLASEFMRNPKRVVIDDTHSELNITQQFYEVSNQANKMPLLITLLLCYKPASTLIFCNTKEKTTQLASELCRAGFSATALNGDMDQIKRDETIIRFSNQSCSILVATDVAARGIDIKELPAVINFDLAFEHDVHIHRIGRTGRAGKQGLALSITTPADAERLCLIETDLSQPIKFQKASSVTIPDKSCPWLPEMVTLCLHAGRKDKIRAGDILGALIKDAGLTPNFIGKIDITPLCSYVAIHRSQIDKAYQYLQHGKLKGRRIQVKKLLQ